MNPLSRQQQHDLLIYGACCVDPGASYADVIMIDNTLTHRLSPFKGESPVMICSTPQHEGPSRIEELFESPQISGRFDALRLLSAVDDIKPIPGNISRVAENALKLKAKQARKRKGKQS